MRRARPLLWLADWANPIVVKEIRQAVRSRAFVGLFLLLLGACVVIALYACSAHRDGGRDMGRDTYYAYLLSLAVAGMVVMPMMAFQSLGNERMDQAYELITISGLGPGHIVRGKLLAVVLQMGLLYSALVPFMAFTYFLRGIALPDMLLGLAGVFLGSMFLIMLAISASTLAATKRGHGAVRLLFFLGIVYLSFMVLGTGARWASRPWRLIPIVGAGSPGTSFWKPILYAVLVLGSYFAIFYFLAESRLTFPSDNRSTALRLTLVGQTLLFGGLCWGSVAFHAEPYAWVTWGSAMVAQWGVAGLFMTTEPPGMSRRVARTVPRRGIVRVLLTPFWPGRARGWTCLFLGLVLTLTITYAGLSGVGRGPSTIAIRRYRSYGARGYLATWTPTVLAAQVMVYLGLLNVLYSTVLRRWRRPQVERLSMLLLFGLGVLLPPLIEITFDWRLYEVAMLHILNPLFVGQLVQRSNMTAVVAALALGGTTMLLHAPFVRRAFAEMGGAARENRRRQHQAARHKDPGGVTRHA